MAYALRLTLISALLNVGLLCFILSFYFIPIRRSAEDLLQKGAVCSLRRRFIDGNYTQLLYDIRVIVSIHHIIMF